MLPSSSYISLKRYSKNRGKKSKGSQHAKVKELMEKTKIRRYKWIRLSPQPLVSEITAKFPHLRQNKWVSNTLKLTVTLSTLYFSSDGNLRLLHYVNLDHLFAIGPCALRLNIFTLSNCLTQCKIL